MVALPTRKPSPRSTAPGAVLETVTGISAACFVNAYKVTQRSGALWMDWTVAPCDATNYWLLGVTGYGELGDYTWLGYG